MGFKRSKSGGLFWDAAIMNTRTYKRYVQRLTDLALSVFEWEGLPETVDPRYIELALFNSGSAVYFRDEVIGDLCLDCVTQGKFDVYGEPVRRRAYSRYNNYQMTLTKDNSVMIWNNSIRTNTIFDVELFSKRLTLLDRIIDVNVNGQKTPVIVQGSEKQRLTLINLYQKYDGNEPFIFGDSSLDLNSLKTLNTGAPYVSDKIYQLKEKIWNEALTFLGISNMTINKKSRLITDEVQRSQGGTIASRFSRLEARRAAVEKINNMFGTEITVNYRGDTAEEGEDTTTPPRDPEDLGGEVYE